MRLLLLLGCLGGLACGAEVAEGPPPMPDVNLFVQQAYPVLLRDCGFAACHGAQGRFFRVVGPGRVRLNPLPDADVFAPATNEELSFSYDRARSMLQADTPADSLFVLKPLETSAGGIGHEGVDELGRDVYTTAGDPGWLALRAWALSASPIPAAQPTAGIQGGQGGAGGTGPAPVAP